MTGYVYNGTAWKELVAPGLSVNAPSGLKDVELAHVWTGTEWREWYRKTVSAPDNFRATNLGAGTVSVNLAWDAVPGATSYSLFYRTNDTGTYTKYSDVTGNVASNVPMDADVKYGWYVTANVNGVQGAYSPALRVKAGHTETSIPAGAMTVSGGVVSHNRWRQNQWGYGGSNVPYFGWYDTEANRYHGFLEIPNWVLWNAVVAVNPALRAYPSSVACSYAKLSLSRHSGVGDHGSTIIVSASLGNAISYSNTSEPAQQVNTWALTLQPASSGRVDYSMPTSWFQAIYQNHASYNGILFRPYRNDGVRQPYAAINADVTWSMSLNWNKIITKAVAYTTTW